MSLTRKEILTSKNASAHVLLLISMAMIVVSYSAQTTDAAPGFGSNDRRIYRKYFIEYFVSQVHFKLHLKVAHYTYNKLN